MPKLIIAAVVFLFGLVSMGMVGLKDSLVRPGYCAYCHQDPHYSSWEDSDYLAATHAKAALPCQTCHPRGLGRSVEEIATQIIQTDIFAGPIIIVGTTREGHHVICIERFRCTDRG